ncbi:MAG: hypothetical protein ABI559_09525 [Chloroflexota bacterium]
MPSRKYHRPPDTTTKRRKVRKIPYEFESAPSDVPEPVQVAGDAGWEEESLDDAEAKTAIAVEERELTRAGMRPQTAHERAERHVRRDYSYVQGEVFRIVAIGGALVLGLIVVAILRV